MKVVLAKLIPIVGGMFFLMGCEPHGRNTTKLQYMPDMSDAPTTKAQETYLDPPDHAVATTAILYPDTMEKAEAGFVNPYARRPGGVEAVAEQGKIMYETYCSVCHGKDGKGEGYMGSSYPIAVPDISRPDLAARKDGFFFMKISQGGAMMPGYGHAITPDERWQIITHIRKLQK